MPPSGAGLHRGTRGPVGSLHAAEGDTPPGRRLFSCPWAHLLPRVRTRPWSVKRSWGIGPSWEALGTLSHGGTHEDGSAKVVSRTVQRHRPLLGHGPHQTHEGTRAGPGHHLGRLPLRPQAVRALAQPDVRLPTAVLHPCGLVCAAQVERAADLRGRAGRPGACDHHTARLGVARVRHPPLWAPRPRGRCCGHASQELQQCAGRLDAGHVAKCGPPGDGHRARPPSEGLAGVHHGRPAPGVARLAACLLQTAPARRVCRDGPDVCVQNDLVRGGGANDVRQPPPVRRAPRGPARRAAILAEHASFAPTRGVFASAAHRCARPCASPACCVVPCGDRHRRAVPRAGQAGQLDRLTAVRLDPLPRLLGQQRRGHDPAVLACFLQRAREPRAARPRVVEKDAGRGCRWHRADAGLARTLAGAARPHVGARSTRILRHGGDRHGLLVDIQADAECARLGHG